MVRVPKGWDRQPGEEETSAKPSALGLCGGHSSSAGGRDMAMHSGRSLPMSKNSIS